MALIVAIVALGLFAMNAAAVARGAGSPAMGVESGARIQASAVLSEAVLSEADPTDRADPATHADRVATDADEHPEEGRRVRPAQTVASRTFRHSRSLPATDDRSARGVALLPERPPRA